MGLLGRSPRGAKQHGKSTTCWRCHGTGQVTYDWGAMAKCPTCLGKGRTTPEDRRAGLILVGIVIAFVIVLILAHVTY
jgi:hypothetical protein